MHVNLCLTYLTKKTLRRFWSNISVSSVSTWSPLAVAFNTQPENLGYDYVKRDQGLFLNPSLASYHGMYALIDRGIAKTDKYINEILNPHRNRKVVQIFDDLSDGLCVVADLAEFVRMMHPEGMFSEAGEEACITMSGIVEKLNTNRDLYNILKEITEKGDKFEMTALDRHVARLFLFDFEQCGIHLPEKERKQVVDLNDIILQSGQRFSHYCGQSQCVPKDTVPANIRHFFQQNEDNIVVHGFSDLSDESAREFAYKTYLQPNQHQEHFLDKILSARHKLANMCGFPTYAHRSLKGSTAEEPEFVLNFLDCLNEKMSAYVERDFNFMKRIKETESDMPLAMWDVSYLTFRAKRDWLGANSAAFSPYFSLGACMQGISHLFLRLFDVVLEHKLLQPGEGWSADVYKLAVIEAKEERILGYIYCDFYERRGKPNQDCHFTIKGGRRLADGSYQNPVVVVVLNFPPPNSSQPCLLTPNMVENLFHEMGHAIHSMLGRTEYQHVTGTRCSTDFAEVPSVLMEYFANDPKVITTFAKHYETQEPMPEKMMDRLICSRRLFLAAELQAQVFYSAMDFAYHMRNAAGRTTEILEEIQRNYYPIPYVENTAWQLRFSHLVGYGAKYYSYLLSRSIAASIWETSFREDPFSRKEGERYRRECLAHGGGKPSRDLVQDYLRMDITPENLTRAVVDDMEVNYKRIFF